MKKYLSLMLVVVLLLSLAACKTENNVSSDYSSSSVETGNTISEVIQATDDNTNNIDTASPENTILNNDNKSDSSVVATPKDDDTSIKTPTENSSMSSREQMNGTWRFILPENKHTGDVYAFLGHRLVYDLTISADNTVTLIEKHFKRSDFDTVGDIEYFEGNRYTLMFTSQDINRYSFKGEISITADNEKTAIIILNGLETATSQYKINEKHYFVLNENGQFKWVKVDTISNEIDKQYFPWDIETVFTKNTAQ